jgi:phosphate transport system substrate-binding protein
LEQIAAIYTGEITNWNEVGGNDGEIVLIGREAGSGTRDGFESITGTEDACKYRQELTSTGDVITTVAGNPNAIGYASLASIKNSVKAISVGGVAPSEATIKDGSYAVQRPFVLVTKTDAELSETAKKFFDYITSADANEIITSAGVVPAN